MNDTREEIELWAMRNYSARNMRSFVTTAMKKSDNADVKMNKSGNKETLARGKDNVKMKKSSTTPWGSSNKDALARVKADVKIKPLPPATLSEREKTELVTEISNYTVAQMNERFGRLYEMFLANEISSSGRWERYRHFTSSIYVGDLISFERWVAYDQTYHVRLLDLRGYQDKTILFLKEYKSVYAALREKFIGKENELSKKHPISLTYLNRINKLLEFVQTTTKANANMWSTYLSAMVFNPKNTEPLLKEFNTIGLITDLEIDMAGHTTMSVGGTKYRLHFGEIKSSASKKGTVKGIMQLMRLGYCAMWTLDAMRKNIVAKEFIVEGTLFLNDDSQGEYNYKSPFSLDYMRAVAGRIKQLFNEPPPGMKLRISCQLVRNNVINDMRDYYIVIDI